MKRVMLIILVFAFIIGCQSPQEKCEAPFEKIDGQCCLDLNENSLCDKDEPDKPEIVEDESEEIVAEPEEPPVNYEEKKFFTGMDAVITLSAKLTKESNRRIVGYKDFMNKEGKYDTGYCPKLKEMADDRNKIVEQLKNLAPPEPFVEYHAAILETARLKFQSSEAMYNSCMAGAAYDKADFAEESINYAKEASEKRKEYSAMRETLLETYG